MPIISVEIMKIINERENVIQGDNKNNKWKGKSDTRCVVMRWGNSEM